MEKQGGGACRRGYSAFPVRLVHGAGPCCPLSTGKACFLGATSTACLSPLTFHQLFFYRWSLDRRDFLFRSPLALVMFRDHRSRADLSPKTSLAVPAQRVFCNSRVRVAPTLRIVASTLQPLFRI